MNPTPDYPLEGVEFPVLARMAAAATAALWDPEHQTFFRDTVDRDQARKKSKFPFRPTATCRCAEEMFDAREAPVDGMAYDDEALAAMAETIVGADLDAILKVSELRYPQFTTALAVVATAKVATKTDPAKMAECAKKAQEKLQILVPRLLNTLPNTSADPHPFVLFHMMRALQASLSHLEQPDEAKAKIEEILKKIHTETLKLLAKHHLGTISPSESVVLAFCAAALSDPANPEHHKAAASALAAAVAAQDSAGSWPLGRVVHTEPSRLEISTYEVAWAVTRTFERLMKSDFIEPQDPNAEVIVGAIAKAGAFAERSIVELDGDLRGWASDHPYQQQHVDSWTSAIVLQFAIAAGDLADEIRHRMVLDTFNVTDPKDPLWPDWQRWEELRNTHPEAKYPVYAYLTREVIAPIQRDPRKFPSGDRNCASVLLFGPPGTSKTTIVHAVADALGWPVVLLNPGVFIAKGLEAIEAESQSVFERLLKLRRAVVIFDECDELFRDRTPDSDTEQGRTISAFVTASMLPKLQELHDKGRILFFVCTNHVDTMDPAVLRGGRIDHRLGVGPPDELARKQILLYNPRPKKPLPHEEEALKGLAEHANRFSRSELLRAKKRLLERASKSPWADADAARAAAKAVVEDLNESLTISQKLYSDFLEHREKYSDLHIEKEESH